MLYSKNTKGFYDTKIHGINIPIDAINIEMEDYEFLLKQQSEGKQIVPNINGYPEAIDMEIPIVKKTIENIINDKIKEIAIRELKEDGILGGDKDGKLIIIMESKK